MRADSQDEAVVQQFIQASREIVPTVEVSLAKRIVRPGSNRVLCLAAHTSIPLSETDMASVSDLALRLSDGTNVRLSLSFFNDHVSNFGPAFRPYNDVLPLPRTTIFDADRYEELRSEPKVNLVFATTLAIIVASGMFFVVPKAIERLQPVVESVPVKTAKSQAGLIQVPKTKSAKPLTVASPPSAVVSKKPVAVSKPRSSAHATKRSAGQHSEKTVASTPHSSVHSHHKSSSGGGRESFLIPPPPPTAVSFPPEYSTSYPFIPEFKAPPAVVKNGQYGVVPSAPPLVAPAKPKMTANGGAESSRRLPPPPAVITSNNSVVENRTVRPLPRFDEIIAATRSGQSVRQNPAVPSERGELSVSRYSATDVVGGATRPAPIPGDKYPQLERIVLPEQQ
ncbi:MAG: hypothetical protein K2Z81_17270 [Cyanobacteria bacterium]|nr:hypothetical protein [Cyanobacteriota bacterium]